MSKSVPENRKSKSGLASEIEKKSASLMKLAEQAASLSREGAELAQGGAAADGFAMEAKRWEKKRKEFLAEACQSLSGKPSPGAQKERSLEDMAAFAKENWGLLSNRLENLSEASFSERQAVLKKGPSGARKLEMALEKARWAYLDRTASLWPISITTTGETWWLLESMTQTSLCWTFAWPAGPEVFLRLRSEKVPLTMRRVAQSKEGSMWEAELASGEVWSLEGA